MVSAMVASMRRWGWVVLAGLAGLVSVGGTASAQDISVTVYAPGDEPPGSGAGNSITLSPIYDRASVSNRCGFADGQVPDGTVNQPNFDVTGFDSTFDFVIDCTGPSRVGVVSSNGGLFQSATLDSGYTNLAPYDVGLALAGDGGATATASCEAASLAAGVTTCTTAYGGAGGPQTNFTGPADETTGLLLNATSTTGSVSSIRVLAAAYAGSDVLVAGSYEDVLTVTLSPSL